MGRTCWSPSRRGQRGLASGSREASPAIILGGGGRGTTKPPFGNQLLSLQAPRLWDGQGLALQTGPPSGRSGGGILLETRRERTVLSPSHPVGPHERPPSRSGVSRAWVVKNLSPSPSPRKGLSRLQEHCNPPSPPPECGPLCLQPLLSAMLCTGTPPGHRGQPPGLPAWAWAAWLRRSASSCPAGFWVSPQRGQCSLAYFGGEQPHSPEMGGSDNQLYLQPLAPSSADAGFSRCLRGQQPAGALP